MTRVLSEYDSGDTTYPVTAPGGRGECGPDSSLEVGSNLVDLLRLINVEELESGDVELAQQYYTEPGVNPVPSTTRRYLRTVGRTATTLTVRPLLSLTHRTRRLESTPKPVVHSGTVVVDSSTEGPSHTWTRVVRGRTEEKVSPRRWTCPSKT